MAAPLPSWSTRAISSPTRKPPWSPASRPASISSLTATLDEVKAALKDGSLTESDIDNALRRKFRIELKLGLLDPPEMVPYTSIKDSPLPWDTDRDRSISRENGA